MTWTNTKDGCEIYYEDKGNGPVLVFVSGYMGIADIWHNQIDALSDDYRCITHDNRGYGRSSKPESMDAYSIEQHAEDLKAVLDDAGVNGSVVLVTHSMGGNISTAFTLAYPEIVSGIIYTGTYASGPQFVELGGTAQALIDGNSKPSASVEFFKNFGLNEEIAMEAAKWPLHALKGNAHALVNYDPGQRLSEIKVPVLIIQGDRDLPNPVNPCATELEKRLPNARIEVLNDVNHFPPVEAPEQVTSLIKRHTETCF